MHVYVLCVYDMMFVSAISLPKALYIVHFVFDNHAELDICHSLEWVVTFSLDLINACYIRSITAIQKY